MLIPEEEEGKNSFFEKDVYLDLEFKTALGVDARIDLTVTRIKIYPKLAVAK